MRHCGTAVAAALFAFAAEGLAQTVDSTSVAVVGTSVNLGGQENSGIAPNCGHGVADVALRRTAVGAAFVGGNAALYSYFKKAWWSGERAPKFFFRADWDENFRDQDKFGHMTGGYHLARGGAALLKSACMSPGKAIIWSAAYASFFSDRVQGYDI